VNYSKGISWFDDCRIPHNEDLTIIREERDLDDTKDWGFKAVSRGNEGRYPANLLCSDDVLNDGSISKSGFNPNAKVKQYRGGNFGGGKTNDNGIDYGDKGTNSRYYDIDAWFNNLLENNIY